MKYRVTIDDDIIQSEDGEEEFDGLNGSDWEFYTYDVDEEEISLESLDPEDGDDEVVPEHRRAQGNL